MVKIYVLVGMIASGKSTYCKKAAEKGILSVNDDAIVNLVHADNYTLYDQKLKILYKSIENHIISTVIAMGRSIIIDRGLNVSKKGRKRWLSIAESYDIPCEAIVFPNEGPEQHAKRRFESDSRNHGIDYWRKVALHHDSIFVKPTLEEGFVAIHDINFKDILDGKVFIS